ncbi:MAG: glucosyltransferase domain-containing protein [Lachnospiraceae bacterium]|nr:glucosyltransferase domain-containing protein [Lachnospiraceae bacterium]
MKIINELFEKLNTRLTKAQKAGFIVTLIFGFIAHMPALVMDAPNHDGLASVYFDQNMITSGRWFLGTACGISSFYSLPWLIGVLSVIYLSITALFLIKLLNVENPPVAALIGGLLITFPSIASNFAYVFTMDGYMLGVLFAVLSVYFVDKFKFGFLIGALFLALSMGTYQAYLPIAILLSLYMVLLVFKSKISPKEKILSALNYVYMGVIGVAAYYVILNALLKIQGKVLDTYQGINSMDGLEKTGLLSSLKVIYKDFFVFSIKGNVLFNNTISLIALLLIAILFLAALILDAKKNGLFKSVWFYVCLSLTAILLPVFTNAILLVSKDVTYHLLMRYQWVFLETILLAYTFNVFKDNDVFLKPMVSKVTSVALLLSTFLLFFNNIVTDNIGYSNLQKKYEKTYAYCLRLADRIEQTEGYYPGIPIYMIGVVGDDNFPVTDITSNVTDHMIGIYGDWLLYTPENYGYFYKYYMGITFNFLKPSEANYYDTPEYVAMPSFPEPGSTKVVDGVLYVKTENMH